MSLSLQTVFLKLNTGTLQNSSLFVIREFKLKQVVHTRRTSHRSGWAKGFGELSPSPHLSGFQSFPLFACICTIGTGIDAILPDLSKHAYTIVLRTKMALWGLFEHHAQAQGAASLRRRNGVIVNILMCEHNLDRLTIILRSCQCNAGYEGSGTFCSEINPCTKPSRGGCHHEAVCTMTGPGANNCTCQDGFRGDGVVCVAIDPCQEKGAGFCHSNAECRYIGPGQVSL